jgi:hypothetical protein
MGCKLIFHVLSEELLCAAKWLKLPQGLKGRGPKKDVVLSIEY